MLKQTGQVLWALLHAYADVYPEVATERDKEAARRYLEVFRQLVKEQSGKTCNRCSSKYERLVAHFMPPLDSRAEFRTWAIVIHDRINRELGKPLWMPQITEGHWLMRVPC